MKDVNEKLKHLICLSIVTLITLEGLSATRLTAPNLRRKSTQDKAGGVSVRSVRSSSTVKSMQVTAETSTAGDDGAGKSVGSNSLLPEGFDSEDADSKKRSAEDQKVLSAEGLAVKDDIKIEFGEGHGETTDEALKEAMKDVLQKVVGIYVDSDFRVNNDEIIQDEIITHSNGFIDHYKKMDEEDDKNGRGKVVTIKAWVKMRDFVNRMKKIAPSQKVKVDGLLMDNEIRNNLNAESLLRKEFDNFDPIMDLMEIGLVDSIRPVIQSSQDDSVVLRYVFAIQYSKEKYYKKFLPRINTLLDQVALVKLATRSMSCKSARINVYPEFSDEGCWEGVYSCFSKVWKERSIPVHLFRYTSERRGDNVISIVQNITRKSGIATAKEWRMPENLMKIYQQYRDGFHKNAKSVQCVLSLLNELGEPLAQAITKVAHLDPGRGLFYAKDFIPLIRSSSSARLLDEYEKTIYSKTGSLGYDDNPYFDKYIGYIDITIDKDDVSKIKSAEIKLETNKKESEQ